LIPALWGIGRGNRLNVTVKFLSVAAIPLALYGAFRFGRVPDERQPSRQTIIETAADASSRAASRQAETIPIDTGGPSWIDPPEDPTPAARPDPAETRKVAGAAPVTEPEETPRRSRRAWVERRDRRCVGSRCFAGRRSPASRRGSREPVQFRLAARGNASGAR
jgi:hypothetical protein